MWRREEIEVMKVERSTSCRKECRNGKRRLTDCSSYCFVDNLYTTCRKVVPCRATWLMTAVCETCRRRKRGRETPINAGAASLLQG